MKRWVRNRLSDLLAEGFHDPGAGQALESLRDFLEGRGAGAPAEALRRLRQAPALLVAEADRPADEVASARDEILGRIPRYLGAQAAYRTGEQTGDGELESALAQAALCLGAGLYFEAHEILEHVWIHMPPGIRRRCVQGLIQVAVGFHHAERGSLMGAVNQLAKGLQKLEAGECAALYANLPAFIQAARLAHDRLRAGPAGPAPLISLGQIPRLIAWPSK